MKRFLPIPLLNFLFTSLLFCSPLQGQEYYDDTNCCNACPTRFWVRGEYLYWKIQDTPKLGISVINDSTGEILLGGREIENDWRSGAKFAVGSWVDDGHCFGVESTYFVLPNLSNNNRQFVTSNSLGAPTLAIPFFDVTIPGPNVTFVSVSGVFSGDASLKFSNFMQGYEWNGLLRAYDCDGLNLFVIAGFRFWNYDEKISFFTRSSEPGEPSTAFFATEDHFHAINNFYGPQLGLDLNYEYDCYFVDVRAKVALGANCTQERIHGSSKRVIPGVGTTFNLGGYFALPTNIGHFERTKFSVLPEAEIKFGYRVSDHLNVHVGYDFLYVSDMLYAAKEIDTNINPTQAVSIDGTNTLVGEPSPMRKNPSSSIWAQGITIGLDLAF